ncbi:MAG: TonB-dependent receptor [Pseudomonadota bacterium]|uniref:TonB-dependent receptor domain-containing protein n=1 Tax=Sphingobium sp. TaxID=1912891 RepID=UPI002E20D935
MVTRLGTTLLLIWGLSQAPAEAQRTQENTAREAEDGFGKSVGNESIGIYANGEVRGFSATAAGNNRIEGLYFDRQGAVTDTIVRGSTVRLGLTAFGYPLPAPTGIVDLDLRRAGSDPVASVQLTSGEYLGADLITDVALPVSDRLGVNIDFGLYDDEYVSGASAWFVSYGGVARWRPIDKVELTGFFGRYDYGDEEQGPTIFTAGAYLPPRIERRRFFGQQWAQWAGHSQNYGAFVKADLGAWQIAAGAFNSRFTRDDYASAYYAGVDRNGLGQSFIINGEDQRAASTSGELRVSRTFAEGPRRHRLLAAFRGRAVETDYGGFVLTDLGSARIGVPAPAPAPDFRLGALTRDHVRQLSYAIAYEMRWPNIGELNLGLTRSHYRKRVTQPGLAETMERDRPWLWNAALALTLTNRFTVYGATTRGLEESGVAPSNAINRGEALPALRTRQYEVGARYALGTWRLVAAAFDIAKPYFEIDRTDGAYRQLGSVTHRGFEASMSGKPVPNLSIVAGAVALRPRVSGQAVVDGRLGRRPIGRTGLLIDTAIDYQLPFASGLSVDTRIVHEGRRVADAADTLALPARTIVDLGARYRSRIGGVPVLLRAQLRNAGNVYGWRVSSGGGFTLLQGRRAVISVTADL